MAETIGRRPSTRAASVRAYPHPSDSRLNIPTAELESFARPEEKRPATVRYPRDPTLDPQLVWKGKNEQDAHDLEVPAVPIYIQETAKFARPLRKPLPPGAFRLTAGCLRVQEPPAYGISTGSV